MWAPGAHGTRRTEGGEGLHSPTAVRPVPVPVSVPVSETAQTQHRIVAALKACQEADLERVAETERGAKPVWQHVEGLHWHETYHMGQFQILRNYALSQRDALE